MLASHLLKTPASSSKTASTPYSISFPRSPSKTPATLNSKQKSKKEENGFDGEGKPGILVTRQPKTLTRNERKEGVKTECFESLLE